MCQMQYVRWNVYDAMCKMQSASCNVGCKVEMQHQSKVRAKQP